MLSRFMPMALVLLLVHCSADQGGQMTQVQSRRAFNDDLNQSSEVAVVADNTPREPVEKASSGDTQQSTPAAPSPVSHQPIAPTADPSKRPAPKPPQPAASPSTQPRSAIKPTDAIVPNSAGNLSPLPDVVSDRENAVTPEGSLAGPANNLNKRGKTVATYKFESSPTSGGAASSIDCTSIDLLSTGALREYSIQCSLVDPANLPVTLLLADFSWNFQIKNCAGLDLVDTIDSDICSGVDSATCSSLIPATSVLVDRVALDACISMGAQLVYSVVDKKTRKTTVQVLNLTKVSVP